MVPHLVQVSICSVWMEQASFMLFSCLFQSKALAEKNMRDLLAQKEQAERNVSFCCSKEFLMTDVKT